MPANIKITPEVFAVLQRGTVTATSFKFSPLDAKLERNLYQATNKVLELTGGKWNKKEKLHLFPTDPRPALGLALETGAIVDKKVLYQSFYTPEDVAQRVVSIADVTGYRVLEPSAGDGALVKACERAGAKQIVAVEIQPEAVSKLLAYAESLAKSKVAIFQADFLEFALTTQLFDRVVMNPPFTRGADVKHIKQALKWLKPGGKLVSVIPGNGQTRVMQTFLEGLDMDCRIETLPESSFKASGTNVNTSILSIQL